MNEGKQVSVGDAYRHYFEASRLTLGGKWWFAGTPQTFKFNERPVSGESYFHAKDVIVDGDWYEIKFQWYLKRRTKEGTLTYDSEFGDNNFGCVVHVSTGVAGRSSGRGEANDALKSPYEAALWTGEAMKRLSDRGDDGDDGDDEEPFLDPTPDPTVNAPAPSMVAAVDRAVDFLVEGLPEYGSLYHGSNKKLERFDLGFAGTRDWGDYGVGVYLSSSPGLARMYAQDAATKGGGDPWIHVVKSNLKATATFDDLSATCKEVTGKSYCPPHGRAEDEAREITKRMLDQGFDSVRVDNQFVVYDPTLLTVTRVVDVEAASYLP